MAPVGAGLATDGVSAGSVLDKRLEAWTSAGLEVGYLTQAQEARIEMVSGQQWAQLVAYVLQTEFFRGKSLDYITSRADQFAKTLNKARIRQRSAGRGRQPGRQTI